MFFANVSEPMEQSLDQLHLYSSCAIASYIFLIFLQKVWFVNIEKEISPPNWNFIVLIFNGAFGLLINAFLIIDIFPAVLKLVPGVLFHLFSD